VYEGGGSWRSESGRWWDPTLREARVRGPNGGDGAEQPAGDGRGEVGVALHQGVAEPGATGVGDWKS